MAKPIDHTLLLALGPRTGFDRAVLAVAASLPQPLARLTSLGWLWFRLRPTTLTGVMRTALVRGLERLAACPDESLRHVSPAPDRRLNGRTPR
jgi:hypothetical protein